MTNIIKVKFNKEGRPHGREYSYLTPIEVAIGDVVEIETSGKVAKGTVTQTNVHESEIKAFKDKVKTILGKENPHKKTYKCPRCGVGRMGYPEESNKLSRVANVYICRGCGTDEAKRVIAKEDAIPINSWAMITGITVETSN